MALIRHLKSPCWTGGQSSGGEWLLSTALVTGPQCCSISSSLCCCLGLYIFLWWWFSSWIFALLPIPTSAILSLVTFSPFSSHESLFYRLSLIIAQWSEPRYVAELNRSPDWDPWVTEIYISRKRRGCKCVRAWFMDAQMCKWFFARHQDQKCWWGCILWLICPGTVRGLCATVIVCLTSREPLCKHFRVNSEPGWAYFHSSHPLLQPQPLPGSAPFGRAETSSAWPFLLNAFSQYLHSRCSLFLSYLYGTHLVQALVCCHSVE